MRARARLHWHRLYSYLAARDNSSIFCFLEQQKPSGSQKRSAAFRFAPENWPKRFTKRADQCVRKTRASWPAHANVCRRSRMFSRVAQQVSRLRCHRAELNPSISNPISLLDFGRQFSLHSRLSLTSRSRSPSRARPNEPMRFRLKTVQFNSPTWAFPESHFRPHAEWSRHLASGFRLENSFEGGVLVWKMAACQVEKEENV